MKKTKNKWSTKECGRCGDPHSGYSGKLDSKGVEYVVCGQTGKRMNVDPYLDTSSIKDMMYPTYWEKDDWGEEFKDCGKYTFLSKPQNIKIVSGNNHGLTKIIVKTRAIDGNEQLETMEIPNNDSK